MIRNIYVIKYTSRQLKGLGRKYKYLIIQNTAVLDEENKKKSSLAEILPSKQMIIR